MVRVLLVVIGLVLGFSCSGIGGADAGGTGGGGGSSPCTNSIGLSVAVSDAGIVGTFNADRFVSSYDWVRVPAGHEGDACFDYVVSNRVKQVIIQGADPIAAKIDGGTVRYHTLPVPPTGATYCWKSSTGKVACASADAGTELADPGPTLGAGTYLLVFYEPGFPTGQETGRAKFTLP